MILSGSKKKKKIKPEKILLTFPKYYGNVVNKSIEQKTLLKSINF